MKLITQEKHCAAVAKRWKNQYFNSGKWIETSNGNSDVKYAALLALGENPKPKDIDKIIGNSTWTRLPECSDCGKKVKAIIEFGEADAYDGCKAFVCKKCLTKALALMEVK